MLAGSAVMFTCVLSFGLIAFTGASCTQQCPAKKQPDLKFSILSRRNQTGHWIAQVQMEHGTDRKENDTVPWKIDVEQSASKCDGDDSVLLVATVTAPPKEDDMESPLSSRKAPADYEFLAGLGYYKFHTDIKTWDKAREVCEKEGAHLAIVNSLTEAKSLPLIWIHNIFNDWRKDSAYIGTWDPLENGEFVTIFNETLDEAGYNKWFPDEPDFMGHCGMLRSNSLLGNTYCNEKLLFICELKH